MKNLNQIAGFLVLFWIFLTPTAIAADWRLVATESSIEFGGTQTDVAFSGKFNRFSANISFDPANPDNAFVKAEIDLASAFTNDTQRDSALPQEDWFFVSSFPRAIFEAKGFQPIGDNRYNVAGVLTLRGVEKNITLPIHLKIDDSRAEMKSIITLNRADFGIGSGPWSEGKWVGLDVAVSLHIVAERSAP